MAALASYPWLGCTKGPYEVRYDVVLQQRVLCAGRETTFEFRENVLTEVIGLFPSKYIHVGGDECPRWWKACPRLSALHAPEGLADEDALQSYFVCRIEEWLHAHGREMIGWDELLEGGVTLDDRHKMARHRGRASSREARQPGDRGPRFYFYLDYYQTSDPRGNGEPLDRRNVPIRKLYGYDPFDRPRRGAEPQHPRRPGQSVDRIHLHDGPC